MAEKKEFLTPEDIRLDINLKSAEKKELDIEKEIDYQDFPKKLQALIEKYGSSLSFKLCEHLINELRKTLARPLTLEDIESAARIFVNQEKL